MRSWSSWLVDFSTMLRLWKHEISELEGRQKPPTEEGKERKPPSWVKANRPDRPRKERQKRVHGFARRREEPTHRVEHATASCPDCGTMLRGGRVRRRRQIITIPQVRARVTEHVVLERTCRKCGQRWSPRTGLERPRGRAATGGESQSSRKYACSGRSAGFPMG